MPGPFASMLLALLLGTPGSPQDHPKTRDLIPQLSAADPETRTKAACALRELGDDAAPALDALVALLSDGAPVEQSACGRRWPRWNPDNRTSPGEQAASALVSIGSRAVQPLLRTLKSPFWIARRHAAWALGALDDPRAGAPLIEVLSDQEPAVREQAAWALGAIDDRRALNALLPALKDPDPGVRRQAAWAIGVLSR
jgi:HEAT repeat protein